MTKRKNVPEENLVTEDKDEEDNYSSSALHNSNYKKKLFTYKKQLEKLPDGSFKSLTVGEKRECYGILGGQVEAWKKAQWAKVDEDLHAAIVEAMKSIDNELPKALKDLGHANAKKHEYEVEMTKIEKRLSLLNNFLEMGAPIAESKRNEFIRIMKKKDICDYAGLKRHFATEFGNVKRKHNRISGIIKEMRERIDVLMHSDIGKKKENEIKRLTTIYNRNKIDIMAVTTNESSRVKDSCTFCAIAWLRSEDLFTTREYRDVSQFYPITLSENEARKAFREYCWEKGEDIDVETIKMVVNKYQGNKRWRAEAKVSTVKVYEFHHNREVWDVFNNDEYLCTVSIPTTIRAHAEKTKLKEYDDLLLLLRERINTSRSGVDIESTSKQITDLILTKEETVKTYADVMAERAVEERAAKVAPCIIEKPEKYNKLTYKFTCKV